MLHFFDPITLVFTKSTQHNYSAAVCGSLVSAVASAVKLISLVRPGDGFTPVTACESGPGE